MTIGNQTVQVGNETYSLVVTEEDLEKRRIERERQKRLSQETNRRRKALEDKKKLAEERETRKRSLELSKRRQRQTDATERYQRSHIATKQEKRHKLASGLKGIPSLDHVLQQLRSGSTEIVYQNRPDPNSVVSSSQLTNHGRSMFESEVHEQQRKLLEQHKQDTMQEFQQELQKDLDDIQDQDEHLSDTDSLEAETQDKQVPGSFYPAYANYPSYAYSNVDIMSGRTYGPHYSVPETTQEPQQQTPTKDVSKLADSLSRLFVNQDRQESDENAHNGWHNSETKQHPTSHIPAETPVKNSQYTAPRSGSASHTSGIDVPSRQPYDSYSRMNEDTSANAQSNFDDQDSLHGSSSSGNSPVFSHMTSFQRRYFGDQTTEEKAPSQQTREMNDSTPGGDGGDLPYKYKSHQYVSSPESVVAQAEPSHVTRHASVAQEAARAAPNFYIKSYRPWSATKPDHEVKQPLKRPSSAAVSRPLHPQPEREINSDRDVIIGNSVTSVSTRVDANLLEQLEETNNRWASFTKTSATPISTDYGNEDFERPLPEPNKPTTVVAKSITPASPLLTSQPKIVIPTAFADTAPLPVPSAHAKVTFTGEEPASEARKTHETSKAKDVKSILRKTSKYGRRPHSGYSPYPSYQSAAVARQQWVNHITGTPYLKARLNGVEVKDSIEVQRTDDGTSSPKSVRWHEVQYNDGTSATISDEGGLVAKPAPAAASLPVASIRQVSPRGGVKAARPKSAPVPRSKSKPTSPKGAKKTGSAKGSRGRKLKPAKESEVAMEPHPPPAPKKKQLTMSTTINYSIPNAAYSNVKQDGAKTTEGRHRVAWALAPEETVTMDTLKSSGSPEPPAAAESPSASSHGNVVHKSGNQVTIHMTSPEKSRNGENQSDADTSIQLTKTPTDEEINWLWTKVRTCLAQRPNSRNQYNTLRKSSSDTRFGGSSSARRNAWGSPQSAPSQPQQQQASIVSIDGGLLARENLITQQQSIIARSRGRRLIRPNSAAAASSKHGQGSDAYGAFMRRQALLQQRRNKHFMPRGVRPEQKGVITYPSPKSSAFAPLTSPSTTGGANDRTTDSTTAFLLAETLAEQNLSEEQIMKAMDSLQRRTKEAQSNGKPVMPSTLSMEEQRLLASLERLNSRLKEVETAVSSNPNATFFNANAAYTESDRPHNIYKPRSVSADVRYQRSRIRY